MRVLPVFATTRACARRLLICGGVGAGSSGVTGRVQSDAGLLQARVVWRRPVAFAFFLASLETPEHPRPSMRASEKGKTRGPPLPIRLK